MVGDRACPALVSPEGRGGCRRVAGDTPGRVVDWLAGMVIIARCDRCAWCAFRGGAVALPAAELAVRLAEAYRLIAELTAQAGRLVGPGGGAGAAGPQGFVHVVASPVF